MQLYIRLTGNSKNSHGVKFSTNFDGRTCGELKLHLSGPAHDCGDVATLRLIFKGRILADDDAVLEELGIREGATLFLVVVAASTTTAAATTTAATSAATPPAPLAFSARARLDPIAAAAAARVAAAAAVNDNNNNINNSSNTPSADPWQSQSSVDNNPFLQNMMQTNPDLVTNLLQQQLQNNPALQRLMEQNPLLREVLNDPAELRRLLQLQSNPDVRQQQQRLADLALQRAETLPGGFNALRQMYETMQVPLEESLTMNQNINNDNNNNTSTNNNSNNNNQNAGATGQAMPNPWGSNRGSTSNNNNVDLMLPGNTNSPDTSSMLASMFSAPPSGNNSNANNDVLLPPHFPGATTNSNENVFAAMQDPRFRQLMEQTIAQNPQMMRQFMPPQLQHMSDAQLQDMMRWTMQQHPDLLRNASAAHAPPFFGSSPGSSGGGNAGLPWANQGLDFSSLLRSGSNGTTNLGPTITNYNPWASTTSTTPSSTTTTATTIPAAATTMPSPWVHQLQQMRDMGFADEVANRAALQQAHGNLNRAVDLLLVGGGGNNSNNVSNNNEAASASSTNTTNNNNNNDTNNDTNNNESAHNDTKDDTNTNP